MNHSELIPTVALRYVFKRTSASSKSPAVSFHVIIVSFMPSPRNVMYGCVELMVTFSLNKIIAIWSSMQHPHPGQSQRKESNQPKSFDQ